MGGVSKPDVRIGGRRLLDIALGSVADARRVVVVGDVVVPSGVLRTREDPPFGGPVEGVQAGFAALTDHAPWTLLLASDLPDAPAAVAVLRAAEPGREHDGACLLDAAGRYQWLLGRYRTDALARRLAERGDPPVTALYRLLSPLALLGVDKAGASVADLDTPDDVLAWNAQQGGGR